MGDIKSPKKSPKISPNSDSNDLKLKVAEKFNLKNGLPKGDENEPKLKTQMGV